MLIFSRFKKNPEAGIGEDKEQVIDRKEKSNEKKEEVLSSISEVLRKWLEFDEKMEKFDEMVEKGRNEILKDRKDISNKIIEGISGLEDEYDKRLKDLKTSIEEDYDKRLIDLKTSIIEELNKKKEGAVSDFITSKEDLEKIKDLAETVKSKKMLENLRKMIGDMGLFNISDTELRKFGLIIGTASLLPERDTDKSEPDKRTAQSTDHSHPVTSHSSIDNLEKRIDGINIQLSYNKGVKLLKEGDFGRAYECFHDITESNPDYDYEGAWLNKGFALGKLGDVDEEIKSYDKALNINPKYEKALHNMKIAERKSGIKKKWEELLRRMPF